MFKWLTQWMTQPMKKAFEMGKLVGHAEAETEALRKHSPDASVVESDNLKQIAAPQYVEVKK